MRIEIVWPIVMIVSYCLGIILLVSISGFSKREERLIQIAMVIAIIGFTYFMLLSIADLVMIRSITNLQI